MSLSADDTMDDEEVYTVIPTAPEDITFEPSFSKTSSPLPIVRKPPEHHIRPGGFPGLPGHGPPPLPHHPVLTARPEHPRQSTNHKQSNKESNSKRRDGEYVP